MDYSVSGELWWVVLEPLPPVCENKHRLVGGRSRVPDRRCADAILYLLGNGCNGLPWTRQRWAPAPRHMIASNSG
ncbi:MAG: hypothetical protein M3014_09470 [Chloroflexota bacterium]|nr:hypothetical protein [Chloroflexota bacterium]